MKGLALFLAGCTVAAVLGLVSPPLDTYTAMAVILAAVLVGPWLVVKWHERAGAGR